MTSPPSLSLFFYVNVRDFDSPTPCQEPWLTTINITFWLSFWIVSRNYGIIKFLEICCSYQIYVSCTKNCVILFFSCYLKNTVYKIKIWNLYVLFIFFLIYNVLINIWYLKKYFIYRGCWACMWHNISAIRGNSAFYFSWYGHFFIQNSFRSVCWNHAF